MVGSPVATILLVDGLVDLERLEVRRGECSEALTPLEAGFLTYLADRPGVPVSRKELLVEVWGYAPGVRSRAPDHVANRLRSKIERDPSDPIHLLGIRGVGYRFDPTAVESERPDARTTFHGRESELATIAAQLQETRRCVITGPPGVGKSRLALAASTTGRVWVDLRESREPGEVLRCVGTALGVSLPATSEDASQHIARVLDDRAVSLLLLDGANRVDVSPLVDAWLETSANLRVITTTRVRGRGSPSIDLGPLPAESAVALFRHRALEQGVELKPEDEAIRELVVALDGIPLAIELAAARARILPPHQLRDELIAERMDLRGLGAALNSAWGDLDAMGRRTLVSCSVFSGEFSLDAARAVVPVEDHRLLGELQALEEHCLLEVRHTPEAHFHVLEPVRAFVRTPGRAPEELEAARLRHAEHVLAMLEQPDAAEVVVDELLATWRWLKPRRPGDAARIVLGLAPMITQQGPLESLLPLVDATLEVARDLDRAHLLVTRAEALRVLGRVDAAEGDLRQAIGLSGSEPSVLCAVARLQRHQGRRQEAERACTEALEAARHGGRAEDEAAVLRELGALRLQEGRSGEARELYLKALRICRMQEAKTEEAWLLGNLGNLDQERGHFSDARRWYEAALQIHRDRNNRRHEGITLSNLALLDHEQGALERAERCFEEARGIHREVGNRRFVGHALVGLGGLALERGDLEPGRAHLQAALSVFQEVRDRRFEAVARARLAAIGAALGQSKEASIDFDAARAALEGETELLAGVAVLEAASFGSAVPAPGTTEGSFARISRRLLTATSE